MLLSSALWQACDKRKHTAHAHQQAASQASTDSAWRHPVRLPHSSLGFRVTVFLNAVSCFNVVCKCARPCCPDWISIVSVHVFSLSQANKWLIDWLTDWHFGLRHHAVASRLCPAMSKKGILRSAPRRIMSGVVKSALPSSMCCDRCVCLSKTCRDSTNGRSCQQCCPVGEGVFCGMRIAECGKLSRGNLRKIQCRFFLRNEG